MPDPAPPKPAEAAGKPAEARRDPKPARLADPDKASAIAAANLAFEEDVQTLAQVQFSLPSGMRRRIGLAMARHMLPGMRTLAKRFEEDAG